MTFYRLVPWRKIVEIAGEDRALSTSICAREKGWGKLACGVEIRNWDREGTVWQVRGSLDQLRPFSHPGDKDFKV